MSKPNPKLEQYKKILRPILEIAGEVFCAPLDAKITAQLTNPDTDKIFAELTAFGE